VTGAISPFIVHHAWERGAVTFARMLGNVGVDLGSAGPAATFDFA
jgi:hypothetical protein